MKLISFTHAGKASFGALEGDKVIDLGAASGLPDLKTALAAGIPSTAGAPTLALADVVLLPPIPNPDKIFCVGVNYKDHLEETGRAATDHPTIFTRFADTQVAHDQPLLRPKASAKFDYEGELVVVIGKPGRAIAEADAMDHVAGYSIYNDGSIRDWQNHTTQFTPGKNFPATAGFGPWIVTADEAPPIGEMTVTTRLNGEVLQHASCSLLIFNVPQIIAYLSAFTPLSAGDIISTGTPGGVGAKRVPPVWMKGGDVAEIEIAGVGLLRNTVVDEA
jgi:2-keto-4-pentenoate hydratase/2-oxohepta-3-ene-1,7-dioic acid hydratase in catechol pathway